MKEDKTENGAHGGQRAGSGRKPSPPNLKKIRFNTKIPAWLKEWLISEERTESAPVLIEKALSRMFKLKPPKPEQKWYENL